MHFNPNYDGTTQISGMGLSGFYIDNLRAVAAKDRNQLGKQEFHPRF